MAIHWKVQFRSLRSGTYYTVNVYDDSYSGTPIYLHGAAQPFTTQEDDSESMFTPVRTQSGYLRIVDTGNIDWTDIIPLTATSRPVTLTDGSGNVLWRGYLQPQTFQGELNEVVQEREFPVMCQLAPLEGTQVEAADTDIHNFGWYLHYILSGGTWRYVYFQGPDSVATWLTYRVAWNNLVDEDGEPKYDAMRLLQDICNFWGWTCRTHGEDLWFVAADDRTIGHTFRRVQFADLENIEGAQPSAFSWSAFTVSGFANKDNFETFMQGIHKATVIADINKFDNAMELPMDEMQPLFDGQSISHTSQGDIHTFQYNYYVSQYANKMVSLDCYSDQDAVSGRVTGYEVYEGDISDKHNYNFKFAVACYGANLAIAHHAMMLQTKFPLVVGNGVLTINGDVEMNGDGNDGTGSGYIYAAMKLGDFWWNGSSWVSSSATFTIPVSGNKIADNRELNGPYVSFTGHGIPVNGMGGVAEFYCLGSHSSGTTEGEECLITSLEIGFARLATEAANNDDSENEYTATNVSKFTGDDTKDLIFASDNHNAAGYGIIMDGNGAYVDTVPYTTSGGSGAMEHPEQHLADRMADFSATTRKVTVVSLNMQGIGNIGPGYMSGNNYPISISHEWRDDIINITMIEV